MLKSNLNLLKQGWINLSSINSLDYTGAISFEQRDVFKLKTMGRTHSPKQNNINLI